MNIIKELLAEIAATTGIEPTAFSSRVITELPSVSYQAYRQGDNAVVES